MGLESNLPNARTGIWVMEVLHYDLVELVGRLLLLLSEHIEGHALAVHMMHPNQQD